MSALQITILCTLWVLVLGQLALSFILPVRFRTAAVLGLYAFMPGIGVGLGIAGAWLGILKMQSYLSNAGLFQVAGQYWDHIVFIVACVPAIAMLGTGLLVLYHLTRQPKANE
ncbi:MULTISPECIES: hypothetical protein [unclassified Mesorhizobium]|uniref:hypothetical protein n=1 Tax=unclassified Mesorhizobium TaxID=325217 RepID=UPI000BAFAB0B|nr:MULTISPECIES: hypothetical protein [unclassified Mesorhizobium]PBB39583.1 hypothetical protein CK221_01815 [Mesorhizobium sp. WSM3868]TGQ19360.1 hypothetical protein EN860_019735 [Mesorhizobium sp. M00.F.Ca.ET.217.01.1.1]TGV89063.1 hypothetical protein EN801_021270 [Mesorhizobium sp. M00.F.Ca.ET.158.01.1.1]